MNKYDLIVIGAGPGGYEAAAHAGSMGRKILLIEEKALGGTCLNAGCIPVKTWLHSAKVLHECREAAAYGITAGVPAADFSRIQQRTKEVVAFLSRGVQAQLKKSGVEILKARAELLSGHIVTAGGQMLEADNILIATGSRSAVPPVPGMDLPHVCSTAQILELDKVPDSLAVIGAGVMGLEFAFFFSTMGTRVTIIEQLPRIANHMDAEISNYLLRSLQKSGIEFRLSSTVAKAESGAVICREADGNTSRIECELVLNAAGRQPVLEGIGLDVAGVEYDRKGIKTDLQGRSNVPGIWACGDVTGRCLFAHAAAREGIVAVNNMFGKQEEMRYDTIPAVIYTSPETARAGATEQELQQKGISYKKSLLPLTVSGRFVAEHDDRQGYIKVLAGSEHNELLGVHILGSPAGELIYGAVLLIEMELTTDDIGALVFPHPSVSEALKTAISSIK